MKFVFATNNIHKLEEIKSLIKTDELELLSLSDVEIKEEIPETSDTIEGNALQKSFFVYNKIGFSCFADDTGLEIEVLDGRPGVYSARYAGHGCSFEDNVKKVLNEMNGKKNRKARFRTVISLIIDGREKQFEGIVDGQIISANRGVKGFGYDPIFMPDGFSKTFAEMTMVEKNEISHRARAFKKLIDYLRGVL